MSENGAAQQPQPRCPWCGLQPASYGIHRKEIASPNPEIPPQIVTTVWCARCQAILPVTVTTAERRVIHPGSLGVLRQ